MEETEGISFLEICRIIYKKIWIVVAVTIALGVICAGAFWIKNKADAKYEFSFGLDFPGYEEGTYPDASAFNYKDIISEESVKLLTDKRLFLFFLKKLYYGFVRADSRLFKPQKSKYPITME